MYTIQQIEIQKLDNMQYNSFGHRRKAKQYFRKLIIFNICTQKTKTEIQGLKGRKMDDIKYKRAED